MTFFEKLNFYVYRNKKISIDLILMNFQYVIVQLNRKVNKKFQKNLRCEFFANSFEKCKFYPKKAIFSHFSTFGRYRTHTTIFWRLKCYLSNSPCLIEVAYQRLCLYLTAIYDSRTPKKLTFLDFCQKIEKIRKVAFLRRKNSNVMHVN